MGGIGSGNYHGSSRQSYFEETKRIDIRYMRKHKLLTPNRKGSLSWARGGEPDGEITFYCYQDKLLLSYKVRSYGEEWEPIEQIIKLAQTPCNYGGYRKWLVCPACNKRTTVLCLHDKRFYCRKCAKIPYSAQYVSYIDNLISKREQIAKRIFDETGFRKKKWMHEKVFQAELDKYLHLDEFIDKQICKYLAPLERLM